MSVREVEPEQGSLVHMPRSGRSGGLGRPEPLAGIALEEDRIGPSLRTCVGGVLERVQFTPGPNNLDLNVYIQWDADVRSVGVSARVVARRKATKMLDH